MQDYIVQAIVAIVLFLLTVRIVKLVSSVTTTLVQLAILLLAALLVVQFALQRGAEEAWSTLFTVLHSWTDVKTAFTNIPSVFVLLKSAKDWLINFPAVDAFYQAFTGPPPQPPPSPRFVPQWMQNLRTWN